MLNPFAKINLLRVSAREELKLMQFFSNRSKFDRYLLSGDLDTDLDPAPFKLYNAGGADIELQISFVDGSIADLYLTLQPAQTFECGEIKQVDSEDDFPAAAPSSFPLSTTDALILASYHI